MVKKYSAGGIVLCVKDKSLFLLAIKDRSGVYTFPKGIIEPGEGEEQTAIREIREETGIRVKKPLGRLSPIGYSVGGDATGYYKHVQFFVFTVPTMEPPLPQLEEHITEAVWLPFPTAYIHIGYPKTNKPLIIQALDVAGYDEYKDQLSGSLA